MVNKILTQDYLHEIFEYRDGELYWKINKSQKSKIGNIAGCSDGLGYFHTMIDGKNYKNHRIIFLMFHGYLPKCIDHIDNNRSNNCIENLREATKSQNCQNSKKSIRNKSGVKNVHWNKTSQKWQVILMINGKNKNFGYFKDLMVAESVAQETRNKYYGIYARHN
jgi:hypothetical protein